MDSEAHFYEDEEDLEMIIERQGDINEEDNDDENDRRPAGSDDEAEEVPARKKKDAKDDVDENKKKRILAPRPKLDPVRLMGPRGLLALQSEMKDIKLKGRGHELQDLDLIMGRMQHWAHRLFPSYTFDDCLEKLEKLGSKKNVMVEMKKIRMGLVSSEDAHDTTIRGDTVEEPEDGDPAAVDTNTFDDLIPSNRIPTPPPAVPDVPVQQQITDEQRERMIRNRMLAEARKIERLKKQQEEEQRIREEEEAIQ